MANQELKRGGMMVKKEKIEYEQDNREWNIVADLLIKDYETGPSPSRPTAARRFGNEKRKKV